MWKALLPLVHWLPAGAGKREGANWALHCLGTACLQTPQLGLLGWPGCTGLLPGQVGSAGLVARCQDAGAGRGVHRRPGRWSVVSLPIPRPWSISHTEQMYV